MTAEPRLYGHLAEFAEADALVRAGRAAYAEGYRALDAFTPMPVEGLAEAIGFHETRLPWLVFFGGLLGAVCGFGLQYHASAVSYPLDVGGRPLASWPAFGVVAFELCILAAALTCVLGMLAMNGLPMPYHPVFNVPRFALASRDRFFLLIEATDARFDRSATERFLLSVGALRVHEVQR